MMPNRPTTKSMMPRVISMSDVLVALVSQMFVIEFQYKCIREDLKYIIFY